jgi:hypothetical protein
VPIKVIGKNIVKVLLKFDIVNDAFGSDLLSLLANIEMD